MKEGCKDLRLLFFVAVGVLVGVLYQVGTPMLDDYWFSMSSEGLDGFRARISWLAEMTSERRMTDNWRLANVFGPLFLVVFPRWVFSVLTGLIVFLILRLGCAICRARSGSFRGWLWAAIFILVFPWYDSMVCVMFALNYVWSTAAALLAIWLFFVSRSAVQPRGLALPEPVLSQAGCTKGSRFRLYAPWLQCCFTTD